ncbi:beta-phosphoglucomutase family hydrolase [Photobacterium japonica]|uniref:HAD family hydrolase n=1 Tax=Photobacterium japonica TaxID=2910235 RepID=UPI003D101C15
MDLSHYQGLIFDMDGTLIDSMPAHVEAWRQTCEEFEIPFDAQWFYALGGSPTIKTAHAINHQWEQHFDPQLLADTKCHHFEALAFKGEVIPVTYQLLLANKATKKIAVGTGCRLMNAEPLLSETGIYPHLDALVTADDVDNHKPEPDTFLEAAKRIGVAPEACLVFEDTLLGQKAALAAGMDCVMVEDGQLSAIIKAKRVK